MKKLELALISDLDLKTEMGEEKKKFSSVIDKELFQKIEEMAIASQRSFSNMVAILLEAAVYPGGRNLRQKRQSRGGKRKGAGRPKK